MRTKTQNKFSPEIRERAIRLVREHQGEYSSQWVRFNPFPLRSVAQPRVYAAGYGKLKKTEGARRLTVTEQERLKALERKVRELRQVNEILHKSKSHYLICLFSMVGISLYCRWHFEFTKQNFSENSLPNSYFTITFI